MNSAISGASIRATVDSELAAIPFIDLHTHLFMPSLGPIGLWGIDELVTYHYLEAELFRSNPVTPAQYFALGKCEKADLIWKTLFVDNAPVSEATRGVIAVLERFRASYRSDNLTEAREFFASRTLAAHIKDVFRLAGISEVRDDQRPARSRRSPNVGSQSRARPAVPCRAPA